MGQAKNIRMSLTFSEDFEFAPQVPEQFFVRAMERSQPIFLTEDFLKEVRSITPDELVEKIIQDLRKDSSNSTDPALTWYYLFMDFQEDFPRLMQLYMRSEEEKK